MTSMHDISSLDVKSTQTSFVPSGINSVSTDDNKDNALLLALMLKMNDKEDSGSMLSQAYPSLSGHHDLEGDIMMLIWALSKGNRQVDQQRQESILASVSNKEVQYDAQIKQWEADNEKASTIKTADSGTVKTTNWQWVGGFAGIGAGVFLAGLIIALALGATILTGGLALPLLIAAIVCVGVGAGIGYGLANGDGQFTADGSGNGGPLAYKNQTTQSDPLGAQMFQAAEQQIKADQAVSDKTQQDMNIEMQTKFSSVQSDETSDVNMTLEMLKLYASTHTMQSA